MHKDTVDHSARRFSPLLVLLAVLLGVTQAHAEKPAFVYYDNFMDFSQFERDATRREGPSELTSYDFPGYVGAQGFGNWGSFVYAFDFPAPIETLTLEDAAIAAPSYLEAFGLEEEYADKDTQSKVLTWVSADGNTWHPLPARGPGNGLQEMTQDLTDRFAGKQKVYVKYRFYMGNVKRQINDPRGACINRFKLAGTLAADPRPLDREYKIQLLGSDGEVPKQDLPARLIAADEAGTLWWDHSMRRYGPFDRINPDTAKRQPTLNLELAGNEAESLQLVYEPPADAPAGKLRLEAGKLTNAAGNELAVTVHRLAQLQIDADDPRPRPLAYNYLLIPQEMDAEEQPAVATYWITVTAPDNAAAGTYTGELTLTRGGEAVKTMQLQAEVFGFSLPKQTSTRTALFGLSTERAAEALDIPLWSKTYEEVVASSVFEHLASRRVSSDHATPHRWRDWQAYGDQSLYGEWTSDETLAYFKHWAKWWKDRGLHVNEVSPYAKGIIWGKQNQTAARDEVIKFYETYIPVLEELGVLEEVYERTYDEPLKRVGEGIPWAVKHGQLMRSRFPQISIFTSYGLAEMDMIDKLDNVTDIWAGVPITRSDPEIEDYLREQRQQGDKIWPYIHADFGPSQSLRTRTFFWYLHANDFGGVTLWSLNWWNPRQPPARIQGNTWAGASTMFWPATDTLIPALALEHIRDGIEDREYLLLLESLSNDAAGDELVRQVSPAYFERTQDPEALLAARREIARRIEAAQK